MHTTSHTTADTKNSQNHKLHFIRAVVIGLVAAMVSTLVAPAVSAAPRAQGRDAGSIAGGEGQTQPASPQPKTTQPIGTKSTPTMPSNVGSSAAGSNSGGTAASGHGNGTTTTHQQNGPTDISDAIKNVDSGQPVHRPYTVGVRDNGMGVRMKVKISQGLGHSMNQGEHALTSLRVAWGDGTNTTRRLTNRTVLTSSVFNFDHVYPYNGEDTRMSYQPVIRLIDASGNGAVLDDVTINLEPTFDVRFGALRFTPLTRCDNYRYLKEGHGDFRVMWVHPDGQHASPELKAKKGRTRWVTNFAGDFRNLTVQEANEAMIRPDVVELDSIISKLKFWEWDFDFVNEIGSGAGDKLPEAGVKDVLFADTGSGRADGVATVGDSDCLVEVGYRQTVTPVTRIPRF